MEKSYPCVTALIKYFIQLSLIGHTLLPSNVQPSDDGTHKVVSTIPENTNSDTVCLECSKLPSKEIMTESALMGSSPSLFSKDDECATLILTCLFCQFYDFLLMLPHTCANLWTRTCDCNQKYNSDVTNTSHDCNWKCEFDCGLFDACQETSECLELALEISELFKEDAEGVGIEAVFEHLGSDLLHSLIVLCSTIRIYTCKITAQRKCTKLLDGFSYALALRRMFYDFQ
eukprot:gi/632955391/ref/XP_007893441.1/ PREDICTED: uncharacterized protein LOC103179806 [Callorhinchus milii]